MLYTLSKANYDEETLNFFFSHLSENDAVVLWQDGVLQAVKVRNFLQNCPVAIYWHKMCKLEDCKRSSLHFSAFHYPN